MFRPASRFPRLLLCAASRKSPYDILGLSPNATEKDIKTAHRKLALKFHPDNGETGNADKFKEIQSAFDTLKASGWKYHSVPDGAQSASDGGFGGGADPNNPNSYGKHWNPPGSTQENYVQNNGKIQAMVRLVVMWCLVFATARYLLSMAFPDLKGRKAAQDLLLRQLEEYENKKRGGGGGFNSENSVKSKTDEKEMDEAARGLQNFMTHLSSQQQNQQQNQQQQQQNSNNTNNNDEFVAWGDLKNKNSSDNNTGHHWPKPDYDPLSSSRR